MGNKSSKKKSKYDHTDCLCTLYSKTKHCCKYECFINRKSQRKQLLQSLENYNAQHIVKIILDYLPQYELTKITKNDNYCAYFHSATLEMCNNNIPPCSIFYNNFADLNKGIELKIGLFGLHGVGRSSLCIRFVSNNFVEDYDPCMSDSFRKQMNINGLNVFLDIVDWCGSMGHLEETYIKESNLFCLCFAKNDVNSFYEALINKDKIIKIKQEQNDCQFAMIFVVTKCDLNDVNATNYVNLSLAKSIAMRSNLPYIETSSKCGENVNLLFEQAIYEFWMQSQTQCIVME